MKIIGKDAVQKIKQANFKIVADPVGGAVGELIKNLFSKLNVRIVEVNMKTGEFGRKIEPNPKTLRSLVVIVKNKKADFGFGLDLDADRMEMVLANGRMVSGNEILALSIESVLGSRKINRPMVINSATSHLIYQIAEKYKVRVIETDVGETNVVTVMEKNKSVIGGEGSNGGVIVGPAKCRDGILTVVLILALMARLGKTLPEILASYPEYFEQRKKIKSGTSNVALGKLIKKFKNYQVKRFGKDGAIKILYDKNSWLFFRASQTEPGLFRIIANGPDKNLVNKMLAEGKRVFYKLNQ